MSDGLAASLVNHDAWLTILPSLIDGDFEMTSLANNITNLLKERAPDLAAASTDDGVKNIVEQVEKEAIIRTPIPNTVVYKVTVVVLGISVIGVIVAQTWIALVKSQGDIPDGLIAIGSAAIGALAGLLAPPPAR
ncbi:hypothetical protein [Sphingomonas sp. OV641]|uniref:hypothetical protein n=1 Tax=Sphingomonas sp. OV641 TaxID=1881068 RepID=UPI00115F7DE4|nr:hypothetical protein [Sphingomonas sp. OV641]